MTVSFAFSPVTAEERIRVAQAEPEPGNDTPQAEEKKRRGGDRGKGGDKAGDGGGERPPKREAVPKQKTPPAKREAAPKQETPPAKREAQPARQPDTAPKAAPKPPPPAAQTDERRRGPGAGDPSKGLPEREAPQQATPAQKTPPSSDEAGKRGRGDDGKRGAPPAREAVPKQPPAPPAPPPAAATPAPAPAPGKRREAGGGKGAIEAIKKGRRERVEDGGKRTIIEEPGGRAIVQEKGAPPRIRHDETQRLRATSRDVRTERRPDGGNLTIAVRPGGIEVYSEFDSSGRLARRYRRDRNGREVNLIDNRRFRGGPSIIVDLRPPVLRIPRERYIVDYDRASDADIYDALYDGPIERLERGYSLEEIRYNEYLRDRMRRIDLDTVNFDFGAWQVPYEQYGRLERIANAINRMLDERPEEIFLIEGHTDAVGSEIDNLTLSDRRAEEVAIILSETFGVPPENLVTQGYGEAYLKVPTMAAERANRRVAVRRITPLMAGG